MASTHLISRRTCLRGLGASLGLPLLETMGWAESAKGTNAYKPPVRLGFMYMPHGVIMDQFWPSSPESFRKSPPPALESLRPVLDQCLLMKGISGVPITPFGSAPHALELSTWLTAALPNAAKRSQIHIAISADQIFANYYGALTALPSLELATMPQTHKENQEGLNEGYYSHCSFRSPTQAMPAEINPRNVLNRLFGKTDSSGTATSADPLDNDMDLIQPLLSSAAQSAASDEGRDFVRKLRASIDQTNGKLENKVIVIYEDGNGPGFNEYRIDLPMYLVSDKVLYSGIALPEFREGNAAYSYLLVGEEGDRTAVLTDINRLVGLEFEKAYPGVVSKAVISTIIKTAAQYAANAEIDRQVAKQKLDPLVAAFMKIGTAATQAAFTNADTRAWRNLPNTIQIAVVDRPASGLLKIETANRQPVDTLSLDEPGNYLILVKGAASQMGLAVSLVKL